MGTPSRRKRQEELEEEDCNRTNGIKARYGRANEGELRRNPPPLRNKKDQGEELQEGKGPEPLGEKLIVREKKRDLTEGVAS